MLNRQGLLSRPRIVVSSNGASIAKFHSDPAFRAVLQTADIVDADGMPLILATRILCKKPLLERVATTDFIHDASKLAVANGIRFFFLGAMPGIAEKAADNLRAKYPGIEIVGTRDGYFEEEEEPAICAQIVASGAEVVWVGLGTPQQEFFASRNQERLAGLAWIRTCGGLFDHCAGRFPRAPQWMQNVGLEWLHRMSLEPLRLGWRYLTTNPSAAYHLITKTRD